jgi:hypothetical protein
VLITRVDFGRVAEARRPKRGAAPAKGARRGPGAGRQHGQGEQGGEQHQAHGGVLWVISAARSLPLPVRQGPVALSSLKYQAWPVDIARARIRIEANGILSY